MRKLLFAALGLVVIAATSCMKDEMKIELTEINDGDINITVVDKNGNPIVNEKVELYNYNGAIEDQKTNSEGVAEFKDILMGTYSVVIEDVADGDMEYTVIQPVQAINSITKEYTVTPSDYSGSVEITVVDDWTYEPIIGINVGVFNPEDFTSYDFDDFYSILVDEGTTDQNGKVTIDNLPFGEYGVFIYMNTNSYDYDFYSFYLNQKGQEVKRNYYFNASF